jgi:superfamily II DNA or RNA helicase
MTVEIERADHAPNVRLSNLPARAVDVLDDELSYEVKDAEHTEAYQQGRWDGMERLLQQSGDAYYAPLGCLERVVSVLRHLGIDYEVRGVERPGRGTLDVSWNTDKELRDYQKQAFQSALRRGSGVVSLPTGSGKTLIGLKLIHELRQPTLIAVHQQEIADQWMRRIEQTLGVEPAKCYEGTRESGDIQVALYQSIYDDGEIHDDVSLDHEMIIADEVHHVAADTFFQVSLACNASYRYGLSATPEREDNAMLRIIGGTGELIADVGAEDLIDDGYLAEPRWHILDAPKQSGTYRNWQDEYKGEIVKNAQRNVLIAEKAAELPSPTYVHVERIAHGERLESLIDDAEFVSASSSERREKMEAFKSGDLPVLISTLGGEGFDAPVIETLIMAGGMKTESGTIQKIGRALRPETDVAHIVDFRDAGRWVGEHSAQRLRTYKRYYGKYGP